RHGRADRELALRRLWLAAGVADLHAGQRIRSHHRAAPAVSTGPLGARPSVRAILVGHADPASVGSEAEQVCWTGDRQSLGEDAVGDDLVQSPGRYLTRRSDRRDGKAGNPDSAERYHDAVFGNGAGVSIDAGRSAGPRYSRSIRDLRRARRAVRELRASADDS